MQANYPDKYVVTLWDILVFIEPNVNVELANKFSDTKDYSMRGIAELLCNYIRVVNNNSEDIERSISYVEVIDTIYYTEGKFVYRITNWMLPEIFYFVKIN